MNAIVVVGLRPEQARRLQNKFPGVPLRFADGRGRAARIPRAEHCVLLIPKLHHQWTERAFRQFNRDRVRYALNGYGEVVRIITELTGVSE